jgi:signal transduction histidine kinase/ligand-binding sensor domain-containing protein/class 3 adenylate cyclase
MCLLGWSLCSPAASARSDILWTGFFRAEGQPRHPKQITAIAQDSRGLMWIGTPSGLYRYDGVAYTPFRSSGRGHLPDDAISDLVSVGDRLLVGTQRGGAFWFDPMNETWSPLHSQEGSLANLQIQSVFTERDNAWLAAFSGLYRVSLATGETDVFNHNPLDDLALPGQLVTDLVRDPSGTLWVATDNGLGRLDEKSGEFTPVPLVPGSERVAVNSLWLDRNGDLLIGTRLHGLYIMRRTDGRVQRMVIGSRDDKLSIYDVLRTSDGNLWLTASDGAHVYHSDEGSWEFLSLQPGDPLGLEGDVATRLYEDTNGLIWVGSSQGLYVSQGDRSRFGRLLNRPASNTGLSHPYITGAAEWNSRYILFASYGGLDILDTSSGETQHRSVRILGKAFGGKVQALAVDREGRVWLADLTGNLAVLGPDLQVMAVLPRSMEGQETPVNFIYADTANQIWVGALNGLSVYGFDPAGNTIVLKKHINLGADHILGRAEMLTMISDGKGHLWFGTRGGGLVRYSPADGRSQVYYHKPLDRQALPDNTVTSLAIDPQGRLWAGTSAGLALLADPERGLFEVWDETRGLPDAGIQSLVVDHKGFLWLGTRSGIARLDPKSGRVLVYDRTDGVFEQNFAADAALASSQGWIVFAGDGGVLLGRPQSSGRPEPMFRTAVVELQTGNQPWFSPGLLPEAIPYDSNSIAIKAVVTDFRHPAQNRVLYRMGNKNSEWQSAPSGSVIAFGNLGSGHYQLELTGVTADGSKTLNVERLSFRVLSPWWASPWAFAGYVSLVLLFILVVLQRHKRRLREQEEIAEHLRQSDRMKDEFLAVISHELRTPLTGIIGLTEAMLAGSSGPLHESVQQGLRLIAGSGRRLASLVNEILDFKKLSHKKLRIQPVAVDVPSLLDVVKSTCQPLIKDKPLVLGVSVQEGLPAVRADSNRLQQILFNLVGNAIKFTDSGQVTLRAALSTEGWVRISVEDTGPGIRPEHVKAIFRPFEQLEDSQTRQEGGSGLGLAITRELVRLHGSELKVESRIGKGSTFFFDLPVAQSDNLATTEVLEAGTSSLEASDTVVAMTPASQSMEDSQGSILVVDDEAVNRRVICDFLSLAGFSVETAPDGPSALEAVEARSFDLVILDVMMPRMSGYEVCRRLRTRYSAIELPVLLISARREDQDIVAGLEAGANDFVAKPIHRDVLTARVKTLVLLREIDRARQQEEEQEAMRNALQKLKRYFPEPVVRQVIEQGQSVVSLPERRLITIVFADLQGFTELTDRFEAEVITSLLNEFVTVMGEVVAEHNGVLNEVLGDGLVILFGAPDPMRKEQQAQAAVRCALAMQEAMMMLGRQWLEQGIDHQVGLRIGVHQDFATVGSIGSETLMAYRAVGSGVNLASRLQEICATGEIVVSYAVYARTRQEFPYHDLETRQFKGFLHSHRFARLQPSAPNTRD